MPLHINAVCDCCANKIQSARFDDDDETFSLLKAGFESVGWTVDGEKYTCPECGKKEDKALSKETCGKCGGEMIAALDPATFATSLKCTNCEVVLKEAVNEKGEKASYAECRTCDEDKSPQPCEVCGCGKTMEASESFSYEELDPGIRDVVKLFRDAGFNTTDSGDGVSKAPGPHVLPFKHVVAEVSSVSLVAEANRMLQLLKDTGMNDWQVEATYIPNEDLAFLMASELTEDMRQAVLDGEQ